MSGARAYLDHNATTLLRPEAREAMAQAQAFPANASSIHAEGRAARALIEDARRALAEAFCGEVSGVVFASGGTEALNLALSPSLEIGGRGFDLLLIGAGEHAAVLSGHRFGAAAETVALTEDGVLDLAALEEALARHAGRRVLLALQAANNETGAIQPVAAAAALVHAASGALVCDAAQAAGRIPISFDALGADALIISGHKFGGPQGAAALCFRDAGAHIRETLLRGGGQERGLRAGTENVAAIAGLAAALRAALARLGEDAARLSLWRDGLEAEIARIAPEAAFFARGAERLPNSSAFAVPGVEAQLLLMRLDVEGIAVSSGSACSSGRVKRSHVLAAMRVPPGLSGGAVRVSLGWSSTEADCALFVGALDRALRAIRARRAGALERIAAR